MASKIIEPQTGRRRAGEQLPEAGDTTDECLFCRRPEGTVTFVVRDREHGYNVCTDCLDDCARTVACSCVC